MHFWKLGQGSARIGGRELCKGRIFDPHCTQAIEDVVAWPATANNSVVSDGLDMETRAGGDTALSPASVAVHRQEVH